MAEVNKRCVVVTGANKGIGFATVQQLASHGITVILTARNEQRGLDAIRKLQKLQLKGEVLFHQLDVADQDSVNHFSEFVKNKFGKLDILVNNAAVFSGTPTDVGKVREALSKYTVNQSENIVWEEFLVETSEATEECFNINYYGTKRMCQAMIPLLQLSELPTIVNVTSFAGRLKNITNEGARTLLSDVENLSEEKIDELLKEFLEKAEMGVPVWTTCVNGYTMSKAAINAYTRILSKEYPLIRINTVCPGYVKTDMTCNSGFLSAEEGAESIINLALSGKDCPSGKLFDRKEETSF